MPRPSKSKVLTRSDQPHHRQPFSPGVFNVANFVHDIKYLDTSQQPVDPHGPIVVSWGRIFSKQLKISNILANIFKGH